MSLFQIGGSFRERDDYPPKVTQNDLLQVIDDLTRLIRELAPYVGIRGNEYDECVWCGEESYLAHKSDCAWAKAQRVLKGEK